MMASIFHAQLAALRGATSAGVAIRNMIWTRELLESRRRLAVSTFGLAIQTKGGWAVHDRRGLHAPDLTASPPRMGWRKHHGRFLQEARG
jgi:hypothetical protein